jgi:hypothetical protein
MDYYFKIYPELMEWFNIKSVSDLVKHQTDWFKGYCIYSGKTLDKADEAYRLPIGKNLFLGCYSSIDYVYADSYSIPDTSYNKIKRNDFLYRRYRIKRTVFDLPRYTDDKLEEFFRESKYYDYLEDKYYEDLEKEKNSDNIVDNDDIDEYY